MISKHIKVCDRKWGDLESANTDGEVEVAMGVGWLL